MSVSVETESDQHCDGNVVDDLPLNDDRLEVGDIDDQESIAEDQLRKDELESRLAGSSPGSGSVDSQESLTREEKLLEEMLRLKLVGSGTGASNSMLPPKQRIKLYQPRSKLEQFEDILLESQLLDQNLPDLGGTPLDYEKFDLESLSLQEALNGFTDYDTTDAIFAEHKDNGENADMGNTRESSSVSGSCECESCVERTALVAEMAEETKKLQQCWLQLREDFKTVYKLVLDEAWNDSNRPHPSLTEMQDAVHKLVWRDPHQLFQRLEAQLKDVVSDMKHKLVELLSKQAKNPSLAQDFIQTLLSGHERLCEASKILNPVLSDLEVNHLRRFSLTWELLSKHMYQAMVYCDPLIQNNLPIFISQLRALYPNKENEDKYTELVRGYLDFDVEMENIGVFWSGAEALILDYSRDQQKLREKQKMLKSDWEKFKAQRKQIENSLREKAETNGESDAFAELGQSLQQLLTGLEDLGVESLPPEMEDEMRRAMSMSPHPSMNLDSESIASSVFASQFGTPYGLSPAEEVAFSSMIQQMIVSGPGGLVDTDPMIEQMMWDTEPQWENDDNQDDHEGCFIEEINEEEFEEVEEIDCKNEIGDTCECHVCTAPASGTSGPSSEPLFPPTTVSSTVTSSSLYPHLYNLPGYSSSTSTAASVSSVASLSAALSSTLNISTTTMTSTVTSSSATSSVSSSTKETPETLNLPNVKPPTVSTISPQRPTSLPVASSTSTTSAPATEADKDKKAAPVKPLDKRPITCNHKHNNPNAKELKKMMRHECDKNKKKEDGPKKSKSSSAIHDDEGESTDEMSDDSDPEDSCSGSSTGNDKQCACCYCEVFGHGNPSGAPVPSNYPQMRERLRLLLSKKKRSSRAAAQACQQQQQQQQGVKQTVQQQHQHPTSSQVKPAALQQQQQQQQAQQPPKTVTIKRQAATTIPTQQVRQPVPAPNNQDAIAKKDVDEIIDFIEGTGSASEKKRLKKERQKQQKLEYLRAKQEEERRRKAAEEAARKAVEEQERMRKEAEEKALKKSKKKAAQKAKKLAAAGGGPGPDSVSIPTTPVTPLAPAATNNKGEAMMDLENMQLEHIRQQKELLERQKRQLEEQQRKLDEELNRKIAEKNAAQAAAVAAEKAKDAANSQLSKKQAKKQAKKAAAAALANSGSSSSVNSGSGAFSSPAAASYPPPYQPHPSVPASYTNPFQPQPSPYSPMPAGMGYPGAGMGGMGGPFPPMGAAPGYSPFSAPPQAGPAPRAPGPAAAAGKSDQPMVTIKRVMRPDTDEPTVTISVKKDEGKAKEKEQVLFTLVNGQVLKTPSAPDNLIPSAVPMSKEMQKKMIPEDEKLSKKQRKKIKAQMDAAGDSKQPPPAAAARPHPANLPQTAQGNVDLDKLRLPDGVSISKINGPVPERKYFPCKTGPDPGPQIVQSNPWSTAAGAGGGQFGGNMYPGAQAGGDNVIVVDTNNIEEKSKGKKKKNKKENVVASSPMTQQPPSAMWGQPQPPMPSQMPGMFPGMRPNFPAPSQQPPQPPVAAPAASKPKEWTPAQYGGYVPPADGKGGGQVLIKSVNGKVVITPIPGTGNNPPLSSTATTPASVSSKKTAAAAPVKSSPAAQPSPAVKAATPAPGVKKAAMAPSSNGRSNITNGTGPVMNGNNVISNGNNNNEMSKENDRGMVNGVNEETIKKAFKQKTPELEDLNSIFDPRNMDCGEMDAADREIEQFKLFCRDSVPVQNRTKVSFDVRNIAFKKKM